MNPRDIQKLMKKMNVEEIDAREVIIIAKDKELVFQNPKVSKMTMMGQDTYQIIGTPLEREIEEGTEPAEAEEADIQMVMDKTGTDLNRAKDALDNADGDIAQAIININQDN